MLPTGLIQKDLRDAGFVVNIEKFNWVSRKLAAWLGFDINLELAQLVVPKSKIEALQRQIQQALNNNYISARNIARITVDIRLLCWNNFGNNRL